MPNAPFPHGLVELHGPTALAGATALAKIGSLLGHSFTDDFRMDGSIEDRWLLRNVVALLKPGLQHRRHGSTLKFILDCFPRIPGVIMLSWPDKRGHPQKMYFGDSCAIVVIAFSLLDDLSSETDRFLITGLILNYLGIDGTLLQEYATQTGKFASIREWMWKPPDEEESDDDISECDEMDREESDNGGIYEDAVASGNIDHEDGQTGDGEMAEVVDHLPLFLETQSARNGESDLYCAASFDPNGILKVGKCSKKGKPNEQKRMKELSYKFAAEHSLVVIWRGAGHLESAVHKELSKFKTLVQSRNGKTSREHFKCKLCDVINVVNEVDRRTGCKRDRSDADEEDRAAKRRREEANAEEERQDRAAKRRREEANAEEERRDRALLRQKVNEGDSRANEVFLDRMSRS